MKKSARAAARRARWRGAALGSSLAAAVVFGLVVAPAASAAPAGPAGPAAQDPVPVRHLEVAPDARGTTPFALDLPGAVLRFASTLLAGNTWDFGAVALTQPVVARAPATGSALLSLQPSGPVPDDLDLSGARFELAGSGVTATCITDAAGSCSIEVVGEGGSGARPMEAAEIALPAGTYTVRQTTTPAGLTVAAEIAPLALCVSPTPEACAVTLSVSNASAFRTRTEARFLSGDGPVPHAAVTLTGPDFAAAPLTTDEDGRVAWSGWFRPGDWWFTVAGHAPQLVTMAPGQGDTSLPWRPELTLPTIEGTEGSDGTGTSPATPIQLPEPVVPTAAGPTVPPPATRPVAAPGPAPGAGTGTAGAGVVGPVEQPQEADVPSTAVALGAPSAEASAGAREFVAADGPALETESSPQLLTAGLVTGVGILFVALVLTGYGVLRSRTRRRV